MRSIITVCIAATALAVAVLGIRFSSAAQMPKASGEVAILDASKRASLIRLLHERKFQPDEFPPDYYNGAESSADVEAGTQAVGSVISAVISRPDGPLSALFVSQRIGRGMRQVRMLATEDRDRTAGYMLEVWYLLGFKGATGRFVYGASFNRPQGYGEPLPPGWKSPTQPRAIPN